MKFLPKLVLALAAIGSCAIATAQPTDAERRAANREEAIRHHEGMREGDSVRDRVHEGAQATRRFTHRQLEKVRHAKNRHHVVRHTGPRS